MIGHVLHGRLVRRRGRLDGDASLRRPSDRRLVPGVPDLLRPDHERAAAVRFDPLDRPRADGGAAGRGERVRVGPTDRDQGQHDDERHDPPNAATSQASMRTPPPRLFGRRRRVRPLQLIHQMSSRRNTGAGKMPQSAHHPSELRRHPDDRRRARKTVVDGLRHLIGGRGERRRSRPRVIEERTNPGRTTRSRTPLAAERSAEPLRRTRRGPPSTSRTRGSSGGRARPRRTTARRSCRGPAASMPAAIGSRRTRRRRSSCVPRRPRLGVFSAAVVVRQHAEREQHHVEVATALEQVRDERRRAMRGRRASNSSRSTSVGPAAAELAGRGHEPLGPTRREDHGFVPPPTQRGRRREADVRTAAEDEDRCDIARGRRSRDDLLRAVRCRSATGGEVGAEHVRRIERPRGPRATARAPGTSAASTPDAGGRPWPGRPVRPRPRRVVEAVEQPRRAGRAAPAGRARASSRRSGTTACPRARRRTA